MTRSVDVFLANGLLNRDLYSQMTRQALEASLIHARETGWETLRSPHLFMGLMSKPDRTIREWSFQLGADLRRLLKQFKKMFRQETIDPMPVRLHREFLSGNAIDVLRTAYQRSLEMGHDQVCPADLLWAILSLDGCVLACFDESGVAAPVLRVILSEAERSHSVSPSV
jgi:ATP-dependent Clp protease ATP-binding subunit ClpA